MLVSLKRSATPYGTVGIARGTLRALQDQAHSKCCLLAGEKSLARRVLRCVAQALAGTAVDKALSAASSAEEAAAALVKNGSSPNSHVASLVDLAFKPASDFAVSLN